MIMYSKELEMEVLGCIMFFFEELRSRVNEISVEDFYFPESQEVFKAVEEMFAESQGSAVDLTLVLAKLSGNAVARQYAIDSAASVYTPVHFNSYLVELKVFSQQRRLSRKLGALLTAPKKIELMALQSIVDEENSGLLLESYLDKSKSELQGFIDNIGVKKERIQFGFPSLDRTTGGMRIPSVAMIGAYPSVGKTAFALNIAAKQESPVVFFSLEMSCDMIYERMISSTAKINYQLFSSQSFDERQRRDIKQHAEELKQKQFYVFDDVYHVEGHSAIISNIKPKLVIVDYIQKVQTHKKIDNRRLEIDYISGLYKQIAKHSNCVVILLSQIARWEKNSPTMSSLKESGSLEADGDYVAILHRPYVLQKGEPHIKPEEAYILIDKNKFGGTGKLDLHFVGRYQQFHELERVSTKTEQPDRKKEPIAVQIDIPDSMMPF